MQLRKTLYVQNLHRYNTDCFGFGIKAYCLHEGTRLTWGMSFIGIFPKNNNPFLCKFQKKTWKTPNG